MFRVYSTTTCAKCQMVKKVLASKEQEYEEVNLDEKPELREHAMNLSGVTSVPVITKFENGVEKLISVGWNPQALMQAL